MGNNKAVLSLFVLAAQGALLPWVSVPTAAKAAGFSNDGKLLAIAAEQAMQIFDLSDPEKPADGPLVGIDAANFVWNPLSKKFVINSTDDKGIQVGMDGNETEFERLPHDGVSIWSPFAAQAVETFGAHRVILRDLILFSTITITVEEGTGADPVVAQTGGRVLVAYGDPGRRAWHEIDPKTGKWREVGWDYNGPPYSLDATGDLIAGQSGVYDFKRKKRLDVPDGHDFHFSGDGRTLVFQRGDKIVFSDPKTKAETTVERPFSGASVGLFEPSPDGSCVVVSTYVDKEAHPFTETRGRQAWLVRRDGRSTELRSPGSLTMYGALLKTYESRKEAMDANIKRKREAAKTRDEPKAEPANYGAENLAPVADFDRAAREKGFVKISETPMTQTAGRGFRNLNTEPFMPTLGWQYLIYAYGDLSKTKRKVHYLYLHTYEGGKLLRTDEWDGRPLGSVAEVAASFSTGVAGNDKNMTYEFRGEKIAFAVTTDGFVPAKIVVYRRPAK